MADRRSYIAWNDAALGGKVKFYVPGTSKRDFCTAIRATEEKRAERNLPPIGKIRWHDLRHTFGSLKIEQGENVKYVQRQTGNSSAAVTMDNYTYLLNDSKPEAAAKTDAMIFGRT